MSIETYSRESLGRLRYERGTQGPRLVLEVDPGIAKVTRWLIPAHYHVQPQMYPSHITVIRHERPSREFWSKYDRENIKFWYDPWVRSDETYWWLNVRCPRLSEIRMELGLKPTRFTPQDAAGGFHMTVGNTKKWNER